MSRTVYLNGEYLPEDEAKVSVFDRGFVMADAVYEVTSVLGGKILEFEGHMARLARSMAELTLIPAVVWAVIWALLAAVTLTLAVRRAW